ncbi:extracellular solute-binding protein [Paenibacillus abyssi]|uniref:ABC transporter peptide-binding protein YtcQ n=1 Tax=Paenibacillus abyssi TaxID=1340531 RepID=A0A917FZ35_9BACL|nr:extracellular solute-binding protein [Paenibacillus abyssi]GGG14816.1 putative ABC transporter peptide-binding protein YtcQ [Paenibacillus abyssi]
MKKLHWSTVTKLIALSLFLLLITAACSNDAGDQPGQAGQDGVEGNAPAGPLDIKIIMHFDGIEFPQAGNPVETAMEEYTNTELTIEAAPGSVTAEKLPAIVASGDMPQVIGSSWFKDPYMINAFRGDVFWEIGPYLEDFPNLASINPIIYNNISIDGKIYGLPRVRPLARDVYIYRKDWLDHLGLEEPKTVEDFYEMLRAFTYDDPDNNGQDDTYGMAVSGVGMQNRFGPLYGSPNNWEERDGQFVHAVTTPEYLDGLNFFKKLYDDKLISRDFAVLQRAQWEEAFTSGKAGVWPDTSNAIVRMYNRMKESTPGVELGAFSLFEGPYGNRVPAGGGHNGIFVFPKSSIKTEEELRQILGFFEKLQEEQMHTLFKWGVEGTHYELVDGKPVPIEGSDIHNDVILPYRLPLGIIPAEVNALQGDITELEILEERLPIENEPYAIHDAAINLISPTQSERGAQLNTMITDVNTKYIMGELDEAGWLEEIEKWRSAGGDLVAQEYSEEAGKVQK